MNLHLLSIVLALLLIGGCQGDKYLILHPFYSGSHVLTLHHVAQALVNRGHQVVTVRFQDSHQFQLKDLGPNHRQILLALDNQEGHLPFVSVEKQGKFGMPVELLWQEGLTLSTIFKLPKNPWSVVSAYCHTLLSNQTLLAELQGEEFDLAIVDLIYNECGLALAANSLKIPAVAYWAFSFSGGEAEFTTMATPPSHVPAFMSQVTHHMTFSQRMWNTAIKFFFARPFMILHTWITDGLIYQYYPHSISSADLIADLNGAMINTNFVLDYPRLQPTTFINVGGMQIAETPNPLPADIRDFIQSAGPPGVILFTMGFIFQPKAVPDSRLQAIFDALAQLPQKVIMKLEPPEHLTVPANVMIKSFLPQADILAHPNVVLFITHCGMHGVMESIYHSVPMVGMPVFIDQVLVLSQAIASSSIIINIKVGLSDKCIFFCREIF